MAAKADKRSMKSCPKVIVEDESSSSMAPRILATVPVISPREMAEKQPESRKGTDPLRETLPWPIPENFVEQLRNLSIRETVAWTQ